MIKSKGKIFLVCLMLGLTAFNFASAALVTCGGYTPAGGQEAPCTIRDLIFTIERIINFLLSWAWIAAMFYIMWSGYNMMTAGGNSEAIENGKTHFRHAVIGFFLIMASYLLINWIVGLFYTGDPGPKMYDIFRNLLPTPTK